MQMTDYSMVDVGTVDEDCEIKQVRFAMADLREAVIKKVSKDEIVVQLTKRRQGDLIHILPGMDCFEFTTAEGGRA
jgi:hypothetical protein